MRMSNSRRSALVATGAVLSVTALLAGCAASDTPTEVATGRTIEAVLSADPSTFNPVLAAAVNDYTVDRLLYDSLLRKGDDGVLVGGLASEWTANSASDYTFTIRDGATCSDGTVIDATVVADSLNYLANPETKSVWKTLIFGGGEVTATADTEANTVNVTMSVPFATVESGLSLPQSGIVCPAGLADPEGLAAGSVAGAFSGPYALEESNPGVGYQLALREDYAAWPEFAAKLEGAAPAGIYFSLATDESTTVNQLLSGDLDLALLSASDNLDRVAADDSLNVVTSSDVSVYLVFNERAGRPFAEEKNRVAVAQAIDAAAFDTAFSGGRNVQISSVASPELECVVSDPKRLQKLDPKAAAATLAGLDFTFLSYTAIASAATDYVYSSLASTGANVTLENPDIATWSATINNPTSDWDVAIYGDRNTARLVSASLGRFMGPALEDGGRNTGAVNNPEGAAALAEGLKTTDAAARCELFDTAQKTMLKRVDLVPLVGAIQSTVSSKTVTVQAYGGSIDYATVRVSGE